MSATVMTQKSPFFTCGLVLESVDNSIKLEISPDQVIPLAVGSCGEGIHNGGDALMQKISEQFSLLEIVEVNNIKYRII